MADGQGLGTVRDRLLKERNALLDLSTRNRLLNVPMRTRNVRTIEIVDERTAEVYRLLTDGKALTFLPGRELTEAERAELDAEDKVTGAIPQPDEALDAQGRPARHGDQKLQTKLTSEGLQKRLFDVWYDARTLEEEQGVNILYLALGLLRWYDADASETARHAPLVLLPVQLERTSAADKFRLKFRGEPASPNLSLQAKLKAEFGLVLEDFADEDAVDLEAYFARVAETVAGQKRWEVLPDAMVLGFFSFAKFLMYRDLDPDTWPEHGAVDAHPLVGALLRDGFPEQPGLLADGDDQSRIDHLVPAGAHHFVVDADSSQAVVVEEAVGGRTLVVKGPPGTGKSQTITNVIAAAAASGKKVLFVAEKMAALEVVHRRLKQAGLGALALELHSNKANKKAVLEELRRTRDLSLRPERDDQDLVGRLGDLRVELTAHAERLNAVQAPFGLTAQQVLGHVLRVRDADAPAGFALEGPEAWTPREREERHDLARELAERTAGLGAPAEHPWRGVEREPLDPSELDDLGRRIARLAELLDRLRPTLAVAAELAGEDYDTFGRHARAGRVLQTAVAFPLEERAILSRPAWRDDAHGLAALADAGGRRVRTRAAAEAAFVEAAWSADPAPVRDAIVTKGRKLFRFLDGDYKAQIARLRSWLKAPAPKGPDARLALVDLLIEAQAAKRDFKRLEAKGEAFGRAWKGEASDFDVLNKAAAWRAAGDDLPPALWPALAEADPTRAKAAAAVFAEDATAARQAFDTLADVLKLEPRRAFGVADADAVTASALRERLGVWAERREAVTRWIAFAERGRAAARQGLGALVEAVKDGRLAGADLPAAFERACFEALRDEVFRRAPELRGFDGELHDRRVAQFQALDRARLGLAQEKIARKHATERPGGAGGLGPLGRLNEEFAKKRNLLPIRRLLEVAGPAVQQLKPVFMMSPLSVAQFLKPGGLAFDLLVVDEASQIEPVDALGAIARARQIVVVGDERQLPPTRFFAKLTGDDEPEDEEATFQTRDAESILELCLAKGAPHRMLNWHYRSKHQSLIAVSNREFYDNRLFIVPSPYDAVAGLGLRFNHLPHAVYDRGNTRTNPDEAKAVVDAVMRHARETPDQSLGVATFSTAQRSAVLKALELRRREHPELEDFFNRGGPEPFFVKNLENVQGDERDVIFISVGYGKDASGYMMMNFGPLSGEGGERRLNVLISRAKLRCEVFASITADDIDLERARSRGVAALQMFLKFAETGKFATAEVSGRDHDSVFEEQVARRLADRGYDVKAQIGAAGFFIDLAIADAEKPGRYLLGIECDGAQYHSSRSARDRDRLRQQVLEAHGWIIHRIWSADWFLRPEEELKKLEAAIAAARATWRERDAEGLNRVSAAPAQVSSEEEAHPVYAEAGERPAEPTAAAPATPYVEAAFPVHRDRELLQVSRPEMAAYVAKVVAAEGPIHLDEIVTRIRSLWGLARAGARIREVVVQGIELAGARAMIEGGPFYLAPGALVRPRDRTEVASATLRKPEYLPPVEIEAAVLELVGRNFGASREELILAAARLFGFAATSAQLRDVLGAGVDRLVATGRLRDQGGLLVLA